MLVVFPFHFISDRSVCLLGRRGAKHNLDRAKRCVVLLKHDPPLLQSFLHFSLFVYAISFFLFYLSANFLSLLIDCFFRKHKSRILMNLISILYNNSWQIYKMHMLITCTKLIQMLKYQKCVKLMHNLADKKQFLFREIIIKVFLKLWPSCIQLLLRAIDPRCILNVRI